MVSNPPHPISVSFSLPSPLHSSTLNYGVFYSPADNVRVLSGTIYFLCIRGFGNTELRFQLTPQCPYPVSPLVWSTVRPR
jgi:hypothetical protein